ncbi:hypothetical protein LNP74_26705 [Klebsiella pneumoniae subsp. pneumoniae]|nr:hypothetical protein [Klebsiella pneumoniae subsp. pneumoniae]
MPSPLDIPAIQGVDEQGQPAERHPSDDEPLSALAFKLMTDPYVGQLTFIRALLRDAEERRCGVEPGEG